MWSDITLIVLSIGLGGERDEAKSGAEASVPGSMAISMFMSMTPAKLNLLRKLTSPYMPSEARHLRFYKPLHCAPIEQVQDEVDTGILCEPCNGKGWLLCDFCEGQKTNVKSKSNRIYRRCPSCKAVGYLLCSNCKVFKCVTFPNYNDGDDLSF